MDLKIHVIGRDGIGWALDSEHRLACEALGTFAELVDDPVDSDAIHTVWPEQTNNGRAWNDGFAGHPVVAPLNNCPFNLAKKPGFLDHARRHYRLVAQSSLAKRRFEILGIDDVPYVPLIADLESYGPLAREDADIEQLCHRYSIPQDRYLIGLFQRDTEGTDLSRPKVQKGADIFVAIMRELVRRVDVSKFHVVLGGPRRHWIRAQLSKHDIPFTFVGTETPDEDNHINLLDRATMNLLYNLVDVCVVPTRWEGGPRQPLDMSACRGKVLSTPVGAMEDILEDEAIFRSVHEGAQRLQEDMETNVLAPSARVHAERVREKHNPTAVAPYWQQVYEGLDAADDVASRKAALARLRAPRLTQRAIAKVRRSVGVKAGTTIKGLYTHAGPPGALESLSQSVVAELHERTGPPARSPSEARFAVLDGHAPDFAAAAATLATSRRLRSALVRVPSDRDAWDTVCRAVGDDRRFAFALPDPYSTGAFLRQQGNHRRASVLPAHHPEQTNPEKAGTTPFLAESETRIEHIRAALAAGRPVVWPASTPWTEHSIEPGVPYHRKKDARKLLKHVAESPHVHRAIITTVAAEETTTLILDTLRLPC